jgi:hypothetical protein
MGLWSRRNRREDEDEAVHPVVDRRTRRAVEKEPKAPGAPRREPEGPANARPTTGPFVAARIRCIRGIKIKIQLLIKLEINNSTIINIQL